jgi:putative colanic acid biosynthesis acetyltransferase WcaF
MNIKVIAGNFANHLYNDFISHIPFHIVRIGFLRMMNNKIHASTKILMHARLLHFWNLTTGENVVINQHSLLDCRRFNISISNNTDIGPYTRIWTLGHNPDSPTHEVAGGDVNIGHHVWIASGVTILPGVTVGDGAVLASGSVVHKNVEKLSIVAGNPAKEIRKRNNQLTYKLNFNPWFE